MRSSRHPQVPDQIIVDPVLLKLTYDHTEKGVVVVSTW